MFYNPNKIKWLEVMYEKDHIYQIFDPKSAENNHNIADDGYGGIFVSLQSIRI